MARDSVIKKESTMEGANGGNSNTGPAVINAQEEVIETEISLSDSDEDNATDFKIDIENTNTGDKDKTDGKILNSTCPARVEFSQEKDAPELTTPVYDFNMAKLRTLPRRFSRRHNCCSVCSSHPNNYISAWILMGVSLVACTVVIIVWLVYQVG